MSTSVFKARQASKRLDKLTITSVEHQKPYLFVSYKSDDWELAIEEIVYTLQKKFGLRIYYDRDFEDTNESWVVAMKTQMESPQCAGVLAFSVRTMCAAMPRCWNCSPASKRCVP